MSTKSWTGWLSCAALAVVMSRQQPQDPPPKPQQPATPASAPAPAQDPKEPILPPHHPLEGVYELRRRVVANQEEVRPSRGYLAITRRHMFLCVIGPGVDDSMALPRSSVRGWRQVDDQLETEVKVGWYTDASGGLHVEKAGDKEVRRIATERGAVTIYQDDYSFLEFVRVE